MPGTQYDEYDDDDNGADDSNLVKDLRKQIADLNKKNGKLEHQLGTFLSNQRSSALADALKAKGLNPAAAKFYPADADVTDDAIGAWIADNADVFGPVKAPTTDSTETPGDSGESRPPVVEQQSEGAIPSFIAPEDRAAYLRMAAAGLTGTTSTTRDAEVAAGIAQAKTPEELTAFLNAQMRS